MSESKNFHLSKFPQLRLKLEILTQPDCKKAALFLQGCYQQRIDSQFALGLGPESQLFFFERCARKSAFEKLGFCIKAYKKADVESATKLRQKTKGARNREKRTVEGEENNVEEKRSNEQVNGLDFEGVSENEEEAEIIAVMFCQDFATSHSHPLFTEAEASSDFYLERFYRFGHFEEQQKPDFFCQPKKRLENIHIIELGVSEKFGGQGLAATMLNFLLHEYMYTKSASRFFLEAISIFTKKIVSKMDFKTFFTARFPDGKNEQGEFEFSSQRGDKEDFGYGDIFVMGLERNFVLCEMEVNANRGKSGDKKGTRIGNKRAKRTKFDIIAFL